MGSIRGQCQGEHGVAGIRQMIREMDYEDWLLQLSSSEDVAQRRMGNVHFDRFLQRVMGAEQLGLDEAITRLVLRDLLEQQDEEKPAPTACS